MRRREFIAGLGGAMAWPVLALAQQPAVPVVGVLHQSTFNERRRALIEALRRGVAETGFVEGRTVAIEYMWAEDRYDRLPALAAFCCVVDPIHTANATYATLILGIKATMLHLKHRTHLGTR
jgi:hypothetical protein